MKILTRLYFLLLMSLLPFGAVQGQFFNQDFNASNTVANYVSATPNIRQFDAITAGTGITASITLGTGLNTGLSFNRTSGTATATAVRSTDIAGTSSSTNAYILRMTVSSISGSDATNRVAARIQLGTGFTTANAAEAGTNLFGEFYIHNSSSSSQFRVSTDGSTVSSPLSIGATGSRLTFVVNKSGSIKTYIRPDATTPTPTFTLDTVPANTMDIWAGNVRTFNNMAIPAGWTAGAVTDFKIFFAPSINTNLTVDDISMFPIQTPGGIYTLGVDNSGVNPVSTITSTFTSLTRNGGGIFEVLNFGGAITGNVNVNIQNSSVTSVNPETGANDLKEIGGMNTFTTKFTTAASSLLRLEGSVAGTTTLPGLVVLNGADNVMFDGNVGGSIRLNLRNTNTGGNATVIAFMNGATNNTINRCLLDGASTGIGVNGGVVRFGTTTTSVGNNNNTIDSCQITSSNVSASTLAGAGLISSGTNSIPNRRNQVTHSEFFDIFRPSGGNSFVLNIAGNTTQFSVTNCHFYQTITYTASTTSIRPRMINLSSVGTDSITISNNFFGGRAVQCGGGAFVYSAGSSGGQDNVLFVMRLNPGAGGRLTVSNNTIQNISLDFYKTGNCNQSGFWGIWIENGITTLTNNLIGSMSATNSIVCTQKSALSNCIASSESITVRAIHYNGRGEGLVSGNQVGGITCTVEVDPTVSATTNVFDVEGMRISPTTSGLVVENNTIGGSVASSIFTQQTSSGTSNNSIRGIVFTSASPLSSILRQNVIQNLQLNTTGTSGYVYGIAQTGTATTEISNNTIRNLTSRSTMPAVGDNIAVCGIHINATATTNISQNTIHTLLSNQNLAGGTAAAGILLTDTISGYTQRNRIYNIRNTSGGTTPAAAGIIARALGASMFMINNMISLGLNPDGTPNTEDAMYVGLWNNFASPNKLTFVYNSVAIGGSITGGTQNSYAFLRGDNVGGSITTQAEVINNLLYNERQELGTGSSHFAIANQVTCTGWGGGACGGVAPSCIPSSGGTHLPNYNALYSRQTNQAAQWLGTAMNLADYQTASQGDDYTIFLDGAMAFTQIHTADLHVAPTEFRINASALPLTGITLIDYDGEFRRGPDRGADEIENSVTFTAAPGVSRNWHLASNWTPPVVPTCADNVIIPSGSEVEILTGATGQCYTLTIQNGGQLNLTTATSKLEQCWLNGLTTPSLPYPISDLVQHSGLINIQTGGSLIMTSDATLQVAGHFSHSGTFVKGNSWVEMNFDDPSGNTCFADFARAYNSNFDTSNILGSANTNFQNLRILNDGFTTIASTKQVSVGDDTNNDGFLDIRGSGWLAINGNRLTLEGYLSSDVTNTGSIAGSATSDLLINGKDALGGTVKLRSNDGSDNQFRNLRVSRANKGLIIFNQTYNGLNTVLVNNSLELSGGILQMGTTSPLTDVLLHVTNTEAGAVTGHLTTGGSGGTSWVYGRLRRTLNGAVSYDYPVGDATRYELLRMNIVSTLTGTTQVTGHFNPADAPGTIALTEASVTYNTLCTGGYWNLSPDAAPSGGSYDIELFPVDLTCSSTTRPTFAKSPDGAGAWSFDGSSYDSDGKRTGFTSFSDFVRITAVPPVILPVSWTGFHGQVAGAHNLLFWETGEEKDVLAFGVERSADGSRFELLGEVSPRGAGNRQSYQFIDHEPLPLAYYRLYQRSADGSRTYSRLLVLERGTREENWQVFPHPVQDVFQVSWPLPAGQTVQVAVYDLSGRLVEQQEVQSTAAPLTWRTDRWASGLYQFVIRTDRQVFTQKILCQK